MKIRGRYNFLIFFLAFWLAFEPFAISVARANENVPKPILNTEGIEGIESIDEVVAPAEYLDYTLSLRGRSKEEAEAIAWGEWMTSLSGAYALMDDGCTDVFTFYSTLGEMSPHFTNTPYYFKAVSLASSKATLAFSFIANSEPMQKALGGIGKAGKAIADSGVGRGAQWAANKVSTAAKFTGDKIANTRLYQKGVGFIQRKANMMSGFQKMGDIASKAQKTFSAKNVSTFLSHMAPPCGYKAGPGEGFYSYWRWVARKSGLENVETYRKVAKKAGISTNRGASVIGDAKGWGHTVGIGLCVVGIALDSYGIYKSEDRKGGRYNSYSLVKNYVGLALGTGALIAMFCIPIVGQVIGALALIWVGLTAIGNAFGKYNARWKAAYKNSYWFLYENDPEFKSFYDNRSRLHEREKSAALVVTETNFGDFLKTQTAEDEEQAAIQEKNRRVYEELEKQGVLVSYYNQKGFTLPDFGMERLQELWKMKAKYMSWKPTEAESEKASKRGFWGNVGHAINPMTYVSWAGDKIQSREYKKTIDEYNILKVFFNPDYVLMKKYQTWLTAHKHQGGIFDVVGLRIEQSPFNYIPMVGIDTAAWSEDLLIQAFNADAFQVGVKEMQYFKEVIAGAREQIKAAIKDTDKMVDYIRDEHLKYSKTMRKALERLVECYNTDPDREHKNLMKDCQKAFGWRWSKSNGKETPRNIIKIYLADIERALTYDPISVSQKAAEVVLMVATIKRNLDTAAMMRELGQEKEAAIADFANEFTNYDIARYLKEGTMLNVEGGTVADWLSGIYSSYDDMKLHTNLYMDEVEKFTEVADDSNSDTRKKFVLFSKDGYHPKNLLKDLNDELDGYKQIVLAFEEIKDDIQINIGLSESDNPEFYGNVFHPYSIEDPVALDLDTPVIPPGDE